MFDTSHPRSQRKDATLRMGLLLCTLAATALLATGCSESGLAPTTAPRVGEAAPTGAQMPGVGGRRTSLSPTAAVSTTPVPDELIQVIPAPVTGNSISKTVRVMAAKGGIVSAGRHTAR